MFIAKNRFILPKLVFLCVLGLTPSWLYAQDTDGDGLANTADLDDDNDGILDTDEATACYDITLVQGGLATGNDTELIYGNDNAILDANFTGSEAPIASSSNLSPGVGIGISKNPSFSILDVTGISATSLAEAKTNNEYIEFSFTTLEGAVGTIAGARHYAAFNSPAVTFSLSFEISNDGGSLFQSLASFPNQSGNGSYPSDINIASAGDSPIESAQTYLVRVYVYGLSTGTILSLDDIGLGFDYCLHSDTDNDLIFDYLDLDSDADGCSDAYESGATSDPIAANPAFQFPDIDTNNDGLVDAVDDGSNGGTVNDGIPDYTASLAQVTDGNTSCDCPYASGLDTDGDGVDNTCDLDDDNDGRLDSEEAPCTFRNITAQDDLGLPSSNNQDGSHDISSFYGLPNGTATISFNNAQVDGTYGAWIVNNVANLDSSHFVVTSTIPFKIWLSHGAVITDNGATDGFVVNDGNPLNFMTASLDAGFSETSSGSSYQVTRSGTDTKNDGGRFTWETPSHINSISFTAFTTDQNTPSAAYRIGLCFAQDTDGDGIADALDLDADNDGIPDLVEAGGEDANGDGRSDAATDTDGDGLADIYDNDDTDGPDVAGCTLNVDCDLSASTSLLFDTNADGTNDNDRDSDSDGRPDCIDIDADNDGIVDNTEAQSTSTYIAPVGNDTDGDGIDDAYDVDCTPCGAITGVAIAPANTDGDALDDFQDPDSDDDGESDLLEGHDTNDDGLINGSDTPNANTGLSGGTTDSDGDGLLDGFDNNLLSWDATNSSLNPASHPDSDGSSERDWREDPNLPVEWLSFQVRQQANQAFLNWSTATETNADFYEIERSIDATLFEPIGQTLAAGTSTQLNEYQFIDSDLNELSTNWIFYRLKQIDLNGAVSYSQMRELRLAQNEKLGLWISLRPIPADEQLTIQYKLSQAPRAELTILTSYGQSLYRKTLNEATGTIQFNLTTWASGIYYVKLMTENGNKVFKVQVSH